MKKLVLLCALAGLPLGAMAAQEGTTAPSQGSPGMGMKGQGMGMGHGAQHPYGPPAEFKAACEGKKAGDKVSVTMPRGPVQGSCQLMFRPDAPPQGKAPQGSSPAGPPGKSSQPPVTR